MNKQLVVKNIVVIGNFVPQKFDKYFFLKNSIFQEEDILEDSVFMPEFCIVQTPFVSIQITPQQLIIIEAQSNYDMSNLTKKLLSLSNFSTTALGVNFHFYIFDNGNIQNLSKKYFYNENNLLNKFFQEEEEVNYGYYISKNFNNVRLKLDIKPVTVQNWQNNTEEKVIQFQFNFHKDIENNSVEQLYEIIDNHKSYLDEANNIISIYE